MMTLRRTIGRDGRAGSGTGLALRHEKQIRRSQRRVAVVAARENGGGHPACPSRAATTAVSRKPSRVLADRRSLPRMTTLETDYLVVGAGAAGMAFVDEIITHTDADVVLVD